MFNQVIVVEGTHDMMKVHEVYPLVNVVVTNGTEISQETLNLIKELSKKYEIVCLLDPDFPGERIRNKIMNVVPFCKHAFINKKKCISNNRKKVGVEHASALDIKEALDSCLTVRKKDNVDVTNKDLFRLGMMDNKELRDYLSDILGIGRPNFKTFLKRINMFDVSVIDLERLISEYYEK